MNVLKFKNLSDARGWCGIVSSLANLLLLASILSSCTIQNEIKYPEPIVEGLSFDGVNLTFKGKYLDHIKDVKIQGIDARFQIQVQTSNELRAVLIDAVSMVVGETYNFLIGSANATSTPAQVTIELPQLGAGHGQIMRYNASLGKWVATDFDGLTYLGSWNASSNLPILFDGASYSADEVPSPGDFYVVSNAGSASIDGTSTWMSGDWVIFGANGWERVQNAGGVTSFNGRTGVVVPQANDYELNDMVDVEIPNTPTDGQVLKYQSGKWVPGTDNTGGGGGGITSFGGQSGSSQTLAVGSAGTAPAWSSAGDTHTLNIPMASGVDVTGGLINRGEYDYFYNKSDSGHTHSAATTGADGFMSAADKTTLNTVSSWGNHASSGYLTSESDPKVGTLTASKWCTSDGSAVNCATNAPVTTESDPTVNASVKDGVDVSELLNGVGIYFAYKPNNAACSEGQTLSWDNTNSRWICANLTDSSKLPLTGGTLSGALTLPTNGLAVGTNELAVSGGNVGIGTATPSTKLDVVGNMQVDGAVTVTGAMRIGSTASTCDGSTAGTFRWTGTAAQICTGTMWRTLAVELGSASLVSPSTGVLNYSRKPTLTWTAGANSYSYKVWVDDDSLFISPAVNGVVTNSTSYTVTTLLSAATLYYWKIEACSSLNGGGDCGIMSTTTNIFTTNLCPENFILVPGDGGLGTTDFCVAKYEMKNDGSDNAVSAAGSTPYVNINATDAFTKCSNLGGSYSMITNPQWMTIARNIESVSSNWSGAAVGSGQIHRGHTDNSPAYSLSASTDDQGYSGTEQSSDDAAGSGWEQGRTHILSNGEVIWDFSANVWEWVDWDTTAGFTLGPTNATATWKELTTLGGSVGASDLQSFGGYTSTQSFGQWYGGNGGATIRGGYRNGTTTSGIFSLNLSNASSFTNVYVGFRCAYAP